MIKTYHLQETCQYFGISSLLMHVPHSRLRILPDIMAVLYLVQSMLYLAHGHSSIISVGACAVLKTFDSIITFIILCFPFIFLCYFSYFFVSLSYFFVTFHNSLSPLHISLLPFIILCLPCIFLCVSFIFL